MKTDNPPKTPESAILQLDDGDIEARGEAFASLVSSDDDIAGMLTRNLASESRNIRSFLLLVLANRGEHSAVPHMIRLGRDPSPSVRSCAIGALCHLRATQAVDLFLESIHDADIEVRKGALHAIIQLGIPVTKEQLDSVVAGDDEAADLVSVLQDRHA